MDKLQLPHAKLLYFVSELWKQHEITDQEKILLKEKIISDVPKIFEFLDQYEQSNNIQQLKDNLIDLVRNEGVEQNDNQNNFRHQKQQNDDEDEEEVDDGEQSIEEDQDQLIIPGISSKNMPEEVTSPLGNALFNKKRNQKQSLNVLRDVLRPMSNN